MTVLLTFAAAAVVTYLLRISMVLLGDRLTANPAATQAIGLLGPAVMAALVAGWLFTHQGRPELPHAGALLAVAAAYLAARRFHNAGIALAVGLPVFWLAGLVGLA